MNLHILGIIIDILDFLLYIEFKAVIKSGVEING